MRYRLIAGGALLLLLALLLAALPGGSDGRRASGERRATGTGTGPGAFAPAPAASEGAVLRGRVQDVRGRPVVAQVLAFEAGPEQTQEGLARQVAADALEAPARATATTGPDGDFLLRVPEGRYHLLAEVGGRPAALALDVRPGPSEVRLVVTDGERLKGQVVDLAGGVARARVTVMSLAPVRRLGEVESDETGAFEVEGLLPQARYGVWARAAGHGERVALVPASRPVTLLLPCALRLEGQVLERGVAAPGARVRPRGGGPEAWTDSAGRFVLEGLDCSGRTELLAESATGVGELALEPLSEDASGLHITLQTAGGLRVRVVEARSGRTLEGASVQSPAAPEVVWREEDVGLFRAAPLRPGPLALIVRAPGHGAVQRPLEVGAGPDTEVEVALPPELVLAGRILGPEGLGLEGARIHLLGPGSSGAAEVRTGADGRFEVRELTEDTYELRVEHPGCLTVRRELRLPRNEPLELSLAPAAALAVKVLGARGEPVEATVSLSWVGEGRGETVREEDTDARGDVHFGGLVPGSYLAKARAPGYLPSEPVPVEAWDEESAPLSLVLREGLTLSGRVRDARGVPVGGAEVGLLGDAPRVGRARTDAQGRFTLSGLAPGRVRLGVEKSGHPMRDVEVELPASDLELTLEAPRFE